MRGDSLKGWVPIFLVLSTLGACGDEKNAPNVPIIANDDARDAACAPQALDPATPEPDEDALCAVLCQVPGGVDECPTGTPCPTATPSERAVQNIVHASVCAASDLTARACTQGHDSEQ